LELEVAQRVIESAVSAGAGEAEATFTVVDRFSTEARDREIAKLEQSTGRSLSLRVFVNGAKASLSTTDFSEDGLHRCVREAVDAARFVGPDPHAGLPDETPPSADEGLGLYSPDVRARAPEAKIEDALELEAVARAFDARIVNSGGSRVADAVVTVALANSRGFRGGYRTSSVLRSAGPIARDGPNKRVAHYGAAARSYAALESVASIATQAARRAVEMIGARRPHTMRCPVIFERDVAAHVLGDLFSAVNAANVAVGNSFLLDRVGQRIGSELATIVDDGRLPGGLGTSPFDAEGVATRRTVVFERGVLRTFLYDSYYARRLATRSTANASGGGIGPNNFYLLPGDRSLEQLIAATPRGVLVLDTIGFSTESVTGTYSRGARGFMIESGELAYPVDEFTIAGNLASMLGAIDAVADDLRFDSPVVSPSFRVAEMTVSGSERQ
jgi:PmbA protein